MENLEFMKELKDLAFNIQIIELFVIILFTYYVFIRIINIRNIEFKHILIIVLSSIVISIFARIIEREIALYGGILLVIISITLINTFCFKRRIINSMLLTIISISVNYVIYIISVAFAFFPNTILKISNDYVGLTIIVCIYTFLIYRILNTKKIKYGISFLKRNLEDSYYNIVVLNTVIVILSFIMILKDKSITEGRTIGFTFALLIGVMILTIKQSFDLYYKQNLLTKDLEQTKVELESKKQEIDKLEKENLEFSKTSHSLAHKQKALEYKLEQLIKTGIDKESKDIIKEEIENVSKEVFKEPNELKLAKTEIESIDNMFSYMQSECIKNNIKFELQVVGNIYYMINNLISENDLEILIADHLKDAIIAINNSDNSNRSILVRIGKIDSVYSLYIYDSGIEFTKEVLDNLGKKPITTHADTGGTGMGFMNTFDTLNKTKASLIINEIGKPCEDNYTKVIIFKFDKQNEFKVNSYKNEVVV